MDERHGVNRVALSGQLLGRETLRHTPAGVPVIEWRLAHASCQTEAAQPRRVECEIECITIGELAHQLQHVPLGTRLLVQGFLVARSQRRKTPTLHVTQVKFMSD